MFVSGIAVHEKDRDKSSMERSEVANTFVLGGVAEKFLVSDKNIKSYIMEMRVSMKDRKSMMRKCGGRAWETWSSGVKMWWRCRRPRLWIVLF